MTVAAPPQLSDVVTVAGFGTGIAAVHDTVNNAGQVMVGAELSSTVISWLQVAELPQASVAI